MNASKLRSVSASILAFCGIIASSAQTVPTVIVSSPSSSDLVYEPIARLSAERDPKHLEAFLSQNNYTILFAPSGTKVAIDPTIFANRKHLLLQALLKNPAIAAQEPFALSSLTQQEQALLLSLIGPTLESYQSNNKDSALALTMSDKLTMSIDGKETHMILQTPKHSETMAKQREQPVRLPEAQGTTMPQIAKKSKDSSGDRNSIALTFAIVGSDTPQIRKDLAMQAMEVYYNYVAELERQTESLLDKLLESRDSPFKAGREYKVSELPEELRNAIERNAPNWFDQLGFKSPEEARAKLSLIKFRISVDAHISFATGPGKNDPFQSVRLVSSG